MIFESSMHQKSKKKIHIPPKWLIIFCLVFAAEMIFSLPFHVVRYFRPTLLSAFNLTNAELGDAIAIYGITAMLSYFPSGVIADHFSARKLMSFSLFATALGGIYMATIPNQFGLSIVFGYWGITTILLFWSAMIRATREWGGKLAQGRAFGILDGGRGLLGAGAATVAVLFLSAWMPDDLEIVSSYQRIQALKSVIYFYSFLTMGTAILVWFFIPGTKLKQSNENTLLLPGVKKVVSNSTVWLQAIIVVSAYCGYRGLDFYALYAVDILDMNEVSAAQFVANATYLRPVAAIGAGFLADHFTTKKTILATFILLLISYGVLIFTAPSSNVLNIIFANLLFTFVAVYALRGIYFALFEETNISEKHTGTTVGLISLIGFTPDIFFNSIGGRILDTSPGVNGYYNFYLFLSLFAITGVVATLLLAHKHRRRISSANRISLPDSILK